VARAEHIVRDVDFDRVVQMADVRLQNERLTHKGHGEVGPVADLEKEHALVEGCRLVEGRDCEGTAVSDLDAA